MRLRCLTLVIVLSLIHIFMCHALVKKEEIQEEQTNELIDKIYDGSADKLFAALLGRKKLSSEQIKKLRDIVGELDD